MPSREWTDAEDRWIVEHPNDYDGYRARFGRRPYWEFRKRHEALLSEPLAEGEAVVGVKPRAPEPVREERWAALERSSATAGYLSASQDIVPFRVGGTKPVGIAFLGDTHIGARIAYHRLVEDLETIRDTDGLWAVHMGDLMENVKTSVKAATALYTVPFANPGEQLEYAVDRLSIARGKWLALLEGNHDHWDFKSAGINRLPDLARHLGCAYVSEKGATLAVEVGGAAYAVGVKHQFIGNSRTTKTSSQRLMYDNWPWFDAANLDAVVLGHTHEPEVHHTHRHGRDVLYIRSGTYKCVGDSYSESLMYEGRYGCPVLILWPGSREMLCVMDFQRGVDLLGRLRAAADRRRVEHFG